MTEVVAARLLRAGRGEWPDLIRELVDAIAKDRLRRLQQPQQDPEAPLDRTKLLDKAAQRIRGGLIKAGVDMVAGLPPPRKSPALVGKIADLFITAGHVEAASRVADNAKQVTATRARPCKARQVKAGQAAARFRALRAVAEPGPSGTRNGHL
eukprot:11400133-Alexandrium_andersonii.AAC.1